MTGEQYSNILDMLRKVRLLLEETRARQIVDTGASIQGLDRMSNSAEHPTNKTNERLEERHPEQLQTLAGSTSWTHKTTQKIWQENIT